MHTCTEGHYWIEAQEFSASNFVDTGGPDKIRIMTAALASTGTLVVAFQRPGEYLEYVFREDRDGLWEYQLWMRYATPCPSTRLTVTLDGTELGSPMLPASGDFFAKFHWENLAAVRVPKGNHVLRFSMCTGVIHPDVVLLTPTDEPIRSGACERRIAEGIAELPRIQEEVTQDRLWLQHDRNGVPLGGLGTGKIELCQDGGFANISTNNNQDAPIATVPGCFFAVRESIQDRPATVRLLQQLGQTDREIEKLTYHGRYPFAEIDYEDTALASRIRLRAFSPMIPYDIEDSCVPGALLRFELTNPSAEAAEVSLGLSWENLIGCGGLARKPEYGPGLAKRVDGQWFHAWNDRTGNDQEVVHTKLGSGLRFFRRDASRPYDSSLGEYAVLCAHGEPNATVEFTRSYDIERGLDSLLKALGASVPEQLLDTAGREGACHPAGIVWMKTRLEPGQTTCVTFALAWHFPVLRDRRGDNWSVHYTRRFDRALDVAEFLLQNRERLSAESVAVSDRISRSSLPDWLINKIINDQFPLTTCTWFDRDGDFSVNEAPSMMTGCLGTIDQRTASQGVYTSLFPELDRRELAAFASYQRKDGLIAHHFGCSSFNKTDGVYPNWPDLCCSFILEVHRYIHATGDIDFCREVYPRIPRAVDWAIALDDDGDGVPDMAPGRGNTYDDHDWPGCSAFVASMWVAGLRAAADLARTMGQQADIDHFTALAGKAVEAMEERLWNGSFYRNFACDDPSRTDGEDCLLPQIAGEWSLDLVDLPRGLPEDRVISALQQVYARNIVGRGFKGPCDEVQPNGDPAWNGTGFQQYSWLYFGALACYRGFVAEALTCWEQSYRQQWQINRQPWKTRLNAYALNGVFNGLPWYMTNTASWYIMHALSGFAYSLVDGWIRIDPRLSESWSDPRSGQPRLSLPLFGSRFWLWLDYRVSSDRIAIKLTPDRQSLAETPSFRTLRTAIPRERTLETVTVNGKSAVDCDFADEIGKGVIQLPAPWPVSDPLEVLLHIR